MFLLKHLSINKSLCFFLVEYFYHNILGDLCIMINTLEVFRVNTKKKIYIFGIYENTSQTSAKTYP